MCDAFTEDHPARVLGDRVLKSMASIIKTIVRTNVSMLKEVFQALGPDL